MKNIAKKYPLILLLCIISVGTVFGQNATLILKSTISQPAIPLSTGINNFVARDMVKIVPPTDGALRTQVTPTGSSSAYLKTDYTLVPPLLSSGGTQPSDGLRDTYQPINSSSTYTMNTGLDVGYTEGSSNVSPTGGANFTIPLDIPDGVNGMNPGLSIVYNSQTGNGLLGWGFDLAGLSSITRVPKNVYHDGGVSPVNLDETDRLALDGNRLIPVSGDYWVNGTVYGTESERFSTIVETNSMNGYGFAEKFVITNSQGWQTTYGGGNATSFAKNNSDYAYQWRVKQIKDPNGNTITYDYIVEDGFSRINRIDYTTNAGYGGAAPYSIQFLYSERSDKNKIIIKPGSTGAVEINSKYILSQVKILYYNNLIKKYAFDYEYAGYVSRLNTVTEYAGDGTTALNPIKIKWASDVTDITNSLLGMVPSSSNPYGLAATNFMVYNLKGDFNGDGLEDIFFVNQEYNIGIWKNNGGGIYESMTHSLHLYENEGLNRSSWTPGGGTPECGDDCNLNKPTLIQDYYNFDVFDIDDDGTDEIIRFTIGWSGAERHDASLPSDKFNAINKIYNDEVDIFKFDGSSFVKSSLTLTLFEELQTNFKVTNGTYNFRAPMMVKGDHDGNGKADFIVVSPVDGHLIGVSDNLTIDHSALINQSPNATRVIYSTIDMNGDGKTEMITGYVDDNFNNYSYVKLASILSGGAVSVNSNINLVPEFAAEVRVPPMYSDINGDGKTDMLVLFQESPGVYKFKTMFSDGAKFINLPGWSNGFSLPNMSISDNGSANDFMKKNWIQLVDLNEDGKKDLIVIQTYGVTTIAYFYINENGNFIQIFSKDISSTFGLPVNNNGGTGYSSIFYNYYSIPYQGSKGINSIGDQNVDLIPDFIHENPLSFVSVFNFKYHYKNHIESITDGFGKTSTFSYDVLKRGQSWYTANTTKPSDGNLINIKGPMRVVRSLSLPDGVGGTSNTNFSYSGGLAHIKGKGFLGFSTFESSNSTTNVKNKVFFSLHTNYEPYISKLTTSLLAEGTLLSQKDFTAQSAQLDGSKRYFNYIERTVLNDYSTACEKIEQFIFNPYSKYELTNVTRYTNTNGVQNSMSSTTNTWESLGGIRKIVTVDHTSYVESSSFTEKTSFEYSTDGIKLLKIYNGSPGTHLNRIEFQYGSNPFGLATVKKYIATDGTSERSEQFTYSGDGLNLVSHTSPGGEVTNYVYGGNLGLLLRKQETGNMFTSFEYDIWGRPTKNIYPDGTELTVSRTWASGVANAISAITTQKTGTTPSIEYRDIFGRLVQSSSKQFSGPGIVDVFADIEYNSDGTTKRTSMPYFSGGAKKWTDFAYDPQKRITSQQNNFNSDLPLANSFEYFKSPSSGTLYSQKTTLPTDEANNARTIIDTYLSNGLKKSSANSQGTLTYSYHGSGQITGITQAGAVISSFGYDGYGRQNYQSDPIKGEFSYEYNGFNEIKKQTQNLVPGTSARISTIVADVTRNSIGQVTSKSYNFTDGTWAVNYEYNTADDANKNSLKRAYVTQTGASNPPSTEFTYNSLGRLTKKTEKVNNRSFDESYTYDANGRISSVTYPNGLILSYTYASTGELTAISSNRSTGNIWELKSRNEFGQTTMCILGNGFNTVYSYDANKSLSGIAAYKQINPTTSLYIYNYGLSVNGKTGNVATRTNFASTYSESFSYDNAGRMVSEKMVAGTQTQERTSLAYDSRGNIQNAQEFDFPASTIKRNEYIYEYQPPGGDKIDNIKQWTSGGSIPTNDQLITYNQFHKVSTISDNNYNLTFTYGVDQERRLMVETGPSNYHKKTYYLGNYEFESDINDVNQIERTYIFSPDGLVAVYINDNRPGSATLGAQMYYAYTDHLGSPQMLTKPDGTIAEAYNFDAWGRRRDINTLSYSVPAPSLLTRGFTFHEHLDRYGLINMNGRLYDVLQKRFTSPDALALATPQYSQYAYALDNPLKYTDPDGNEPITVGVALVIIGAAVIAGAYAGGSIANGTGNIGVWNWQSNKTWEGITIGGVVGGVSAAAAVYLGPVLAAAGASALTQSVVTGAVAGAVYNAGMSGYASNWDGTAMITGAISGAVIGGISGAVGYGVSGALGTAIRGSASTFVSEVGGGIAGGAVGGFMGGAQSGGIEGALTGLAYGAAGGAIGGLIGAGIRYSRYISAKRAWYKSMSPNDESLTASLDIEQGTKAIQGLIDKIENPYLRLGVQFFKDVFISPDMFLMPGGGMVKMKIPTGFKLTKQFGYPHGQKVYGYKGKYYSLDIDGHNGGVWKVFQDIGGQLKRIGTADENLNIFKK